MSNPDLYEQLLKEAEKREAELEAAQAEFERTQEAGRKEAEALRVAASIFKPDEVPTDAKDVASQAARPPIESTHQAFAKQLSFIDVVANSIQEMGNVITTAQVFEKLSTKGIPLGNSPRTKISTALSRLEERGALIKDVTGTIGRAHSYLKPSNSLANGGKKG